LRGDGRGVTESLWQICVIFPVAQHEKTPPRRPPGVRRDRCKLPRCRPAWPFLKAAGRRDRGIIAGHAGRSRKKLASEQKCGTPPPRVRVRPRGGAGRAKAESVRGSVPPPPPRSASSSPRSGWAAGPRHLRRGRGLVKKKLANVVRLACPPTRRAAPLPPRA